MTKFKKFFTSGLVATVLAFILSGLVIIILAFILSSCGSNKNYTDEEKVLFNQFVVTEKRMQNGQPMYIMYDKDSKAMYYGYPKYQGWMVPIYNSDGSVKIYTE